MKIGTNDISKIMLGGAEISKIMLGTSQVYEGEEPNPYASKYFTVKPADGVSSFNCAYFSNWGEDVYYSTDNGETWELFTDYTTFYGKTLIKCVAYQSNSSIGNLSFNGQGNVIVEGNIMSLVYGDNFVGQTTIWNSIFAGLFSNCENLINAENLILPATTLTDSCYYYMFENCTNLITAPELPATTLLDYCYGGMFYNCTSLTTAPELPATTLVNGCYDYMFMNCTSLNYIKCLATNTGYTSDWVNNVASTGTFVKAASMGSWTTGTSGIPNGWTVENDDGGGGDSPIDPGGDDPNWDDAE